MKHIKLFESFSEKGYEEVKIPDIYKENKEKVFFDRERYKKISDILDDNYKIKTSSGDLSQYELKRNDYDFVRISKINPNISFSINSICIYECSDEWYHVFIYKDYKKPDMLFPGSSSTVFGINSFICDQFDGLLNLLKDNSVVK